MKEWLINYCKYLTYREWILLIFIIAAIVTCIMAKYGWSALFICFSVCMAISVADFHNREECLEQAQEYIDNGQYIKAHDRLYSIPLESPYGGGSHESKYDIKEMRESIEIPYLYELGQEAEMSQDFLTAIAYFIECGDYEGSHYHIQKDMELYLKQIEASEDYE